MSATTVLGPAVTLVTRASCGTHGGSGKPLAIPEEEKMVVVVVVVAVVVVSVTTHEQQARLSNGAERPAMYGTKRCNRRLIR